jgi:poly(A) polymerase
VNGYDYITEMHPILRDLEILSFSREAYVAGGPVRDWLLGRKVLDLDLVVPDGAIALARKFAQRTTGHFVMLDEKEGMARVACKDFILDFSQYRDMANNIEEDLCQRDFTINAMAVPLSSALPLLNNYSQLATRNSQLTILDPAGGLADLNNRIIRAIARKNLESDPLRLLRAYRFRSQLDFEIEQHTQVYIKELSSTIDSVASERISHELRLIMESKRAGRTLHEMVQVRLLQALLPEINPMEGMPQPGYHHLDVLDHSLATVKAMEDLIVNPCNKFFSCEPIEGWIIGNSARIPDLKWAAFLHDIGKPACKGEKQGRLTFYRHDHIGSDMVLAIGKRLRWPKQETIFVAKMVRLHMRPFHLLKNLRQGGPTKRAMRRLLAETGADYPAIFLLAMADSMSGCGPLKPLELDAELAKLWEVVHTFYQDRLKPVKMRPRLLTGHDLQRIFSLSPGPLIGKSLDALEEAQVEGAVSTRDEAVSWLKAWFDSNEGAGGNVSQS